MRRTGGHREEKGLRPGSEEGMRGQNVQEADRSWVRQELHMVLIAKH